MKVDVFKQYIAQTKRILELSSLRLDGIQDEEAYRLALLKSFQEIGELSDANNQLLEKYFHPIINDPDMLTIENINVMREFSSLLVDATTMEGIDLPLLQRMAEKLLEKAEKLDDLRMKILALDSVVISSYMMVNLTTRLYPEFDYCFKYRDIGLNAANQLLEYLDKDRFNELPDTECKELVVINSRYIRSLFDWDDIEDKRDRNIKDIEMMERALEIGRDPFYTEQLPNHPWVIHRFRTLQYLADFTEYHNAHQFSFEQCQKLLTYTKEMLDYIKQHPELEDSCPIEEQDFLLARNRYFGGEIDLETYKKELLRIIDRTNPLDVDARGMYINVVVPYEYMLSLDKNNLTAEEGQRLTAIYNGLISYVYRMSKTGALSFMLTFVSDVLKAFIEVDGGMNFEEFCLKLMVAIHPPTFIHTMDVVDITSFLMEKVLEKCPENLVGVLGTKSVEEVIARKSEILDYSFHNTLMHDVGKLFIVESIMTYGRKLIEEEYDLIRSHPVIGGALLERYESTKNYSIAARGHHKWYNNKRGYPNSFNMDNDYYKSFLSVMIAADCLDAATGAIGRSYKQGKDLEDYIQELKEGMGTRYATFIPELFEYEDVKEGLRKLLTEGRKENYYRAYRFLKEM